MVDNVELIPPVAPVVEALVVEAPQSLTEAPTAPLVEAPVAETPVVETPVSEAVKAPETVLAEALDKAPVEPVKEETKPPVVEEVKPEEVKPPEEKAEEGKTDEPAPPPAYDAFNIPEGVTLDDSRVKEFTGILGEFEQNSKADHALVQEFGQKAVDFHIGELKRAVEDVNKYYQTSWEKQKTDWKDSFLKDPEIGGNRFQTTIDSALSFIRTHGGTDEQQKEFRNLMETSGLGNHPTMIRILANAGQAMSEGRPLSAQKPVTPIKSKTATLYGKQG